MVKDRAFLRGYSKRVGVDELKGLKKALRKDRLQAALDAKVEQRRERALARVRAQGITADGVTALELKMARDAEEQRRRTEYTRMCIEESNEKEKRSNERAAREEARKAGGGRTTAG
jgi:FKBP-type peptidyl-prolyl cis-trans isomerase (trigger factor)